MGRRYWCSLKELEYIRKIVHVMHCKFWVDLQIWIYDLQIKLPISLISLRKCYILKTGLQHLPRNCNIFIIHWNTWSNNSVLCRNFPINSVLSLHVVINSQVPGRSISRNWLFFQFMWPIRRRNSRNYSSDWDDFFVRLSHLLFTFYSEDTKPCTLVIEIFYIYLIKCMLEHMR